MNREETWDLFKQGKEAWNAWADEMLSQRKAFAEDGSWPQGKRPPKGNDQIDAWRAQARADFSEQEFSENEGDFKYFVFPFCADFSKATFSGGASFMRATFSGIAFFTGATFSGGADFTSATFSGNASFRWATFSGDADFMRATFSGDASFTSATFSGEADFIWPTFSGDASFNGATFSGRASFSEATFSGENADVSFEAAKSERAFTLQGSTFATVPNFSQMDFNQAPRVDNLRLHPRRLGRLWRFFHGDPQDNRPFGKRLKTGTLSVFKGRNRAEPNNLAARYRALRRLADEGHDHKLEQEFFADELRAHQFHDYWFLHPQLYAIWIYEALSNIGRSLVLPLAWMALCLFLFTGVYLQASQSKDFGYLTALQGIAGAALPELECASDGKYDRDLQRPVFERLPGDPISSAWSLSARNSLIFAGGVLGQTNRQIQACLFGVQNIGGRKEPAVPTFVAVMGTVQTIISLILIFLFGLALRNNFKIG